MDRLGLLSRNLCRLGALLRRGIVLDLGQVGSLVGNGKRSLRYLLLGDLELGRYLFRRPSLGVWELERETKCMCAEL